jgi:DNA helicase-2/ATP-dependent DNA helicase PcrA
MLDRLDPEQRAAATLPDGPAQIIAPAGSGKTTTLVTRLGFLVAGGVPPERICVVTFNRDAAGELQARVRDRLGPLLPGAERIEIRTLHALARQVLLERSPRLELIADRMPLLRAARRRALVGRSPDAPPLPDVAALDGWLSAWKIEGTPPSPEAGAVLDGYARMLEARHALDFDDLVTGAATLLERDPEAAVRWQGRFTHVCVDEFQDVDAAQLRLVRLLAEPERNLFVVGDDDQTIYAWRLADVRRILDFGAHYPEARRVQLATNYRCPPEVVRRSARLIAANEERFAKRIAPGAPDPTSDGGGPSLVAVDTGAADWPERLVTLATTRATNGARTCILARTRAELAPVTLALVRRGIPHATSIPAPLESPRVTALIDELRRHPADQPPFAAIASVREALGWRRTDHADDLGDDEHLALDALTGWAIAFRSLDRFLAAADRVREEMARLRDPAAAIELVTVHGAKGREWATVVVLGFEEERFPNRRALVGGPNPTRAVEEERRLAYVAVTRATRRLVLAFDPARPSRFVAEMGLVVPRDPSRGPRR